MSNTELEKNELSPEQQELFNYDLKILKESGIAHLEGRVSSGLDPAAMLVLESERNIGGDVRKQGTAEYAHQIAEKFGAEEQKVWDIITKLHTQGPWEDADRLQKANDPEVQVYLILAAACHESGWPGYKPEAYLEDRARVVAALQTGSEVSDEQKMSYLEAQIGDIKSRVTIDRVEAGGKVPVAEGDVALPLAIQGYKGVVAKAGDMRFAQTKEILDAQLEAQGLTPGFAEVYSAEANGYVRVALSDAPENARLVWVKQEDASKDIDAMEPRAKRIAAGYVLTYADEALAIQLVAQSINNLEEGK